MGMDVSFLLAPVSIADEALLEAVDGISGSDDAFSLLVGDETSVPEALSKAMPKLTVISLWAKEPGDDWDSLGIALSRAIPETTFLAVTMSDHGSTGCWQLVEDGKTGPAHWLEEGYTRGIFLGLAAGYGIELSDDDALSAESVCQSVNRGWRLPGKKKLTKAQIDKALEGYARTLEHPGRQVKPKAPPKPPPPKIEPPTKADRKLVEALGRLEVTSPAKRMLIADLVRTVVEKASALTPGQRERARGLIEELG